MSITLYTKEKTFRFVDEFDPRPGCYCDTTVKVEHKQYVDKRQYYYITYTHKYPNDAVRCVTTNPFYNGWPNNEEPYDSRNGDIISANAMSEQMIEYLLMDFEKLEQVSGHVTGMSYKIKIIHALTSLWD